MSGVQLTSVGNIFPVAAFLAEQGEPVGPLLEEARLPCSCLENPKLLVPSAALWRFRGLAAARTGSANLTLHAMKTRELAELGDVGRAILAGPTLRKVIRLFQRLALAESQTVVIELSPWSSSDEFFSNRFLLKQEEGEWQAELYLLMWMLKIVWLIEPGWSPSEIWFTGDASRERVQEIEALGARPRFNRCSTGFPVPRAMLAMRPTRSRSSQPNPALDEHGLWSTSPSDSAEGAIRQLIRSYAHDRWLSVFEASEALSMNPRTLQRQLSEEGRVYSRILAEVRAESAMHLLETSDARLSEISDQLGYSNLSNFNRAFRRWVGVSPSEFRAASGSAGFGRQARLS
jgi:AraC-like DNA-binding protein